MSRENTSVKDFFNSFKDHKRNTWIDVPLTCGEKYRKPRLKSPEPKGEHLPRTSTPYPDVLQEVNENWVVKNGYTSWIDHLHEPPTNIKTRGTFFPDDDFISGHLIMKEKQKDEYRPENYFTPDLNKCFINLLITGPPPLVCRVHADISRRNHLSKFMCLPKCTNCERELVLNSNLPQGYRYDEHGVVVHVPPPSRKEMRNRKGPICI